MPAIAGVAMRPAACAASMCKNASGRLDRITSAMSAIGCTTPVSPLAHCTDTTTLEDALMSARRNASGSARPSAPTGMSVNAAPRSAARRAGSSVAECSTSVTMTVLPLSAPASTALLPSVPPEFRTTPSGCIPGKSALVASRARASNRRLGTPVACSLEGLPQQSCIASRTAAMVSSSGRTVALASR